MLLRKHYAAVFVLTIFLQFTRHVTKALRCNGFVAGPNSAGSFYALSYYTLL